MKWSNVFLVASVSVPIFGTVWAGILWGCTLEDRISKSLTWFCGLLLEVGCVMEGRVGAVEWARCKSFNLFAELTLRWCDISLADPDSKNTVQVRLGVFASTREIPSWGTGWEVFFSSLFQLLRTIDILLLTLGSISILLLVSSSSTYYDRVSGNAGAG